MQELRLIVRPLDKIQATLLTQVSRDCLDAVGREVFNPVRTRMSVTVINAVFIDRVTHFYSNAVSREIHQRAQEY